MLSKKIGIILALVLVLGLVTYGYTQLINKGFIQAVLQNQIDLRNLPNTVFAVSTFEQKLPDGKILPKGTRFIGTIGKGENNLVIYFNEVEIVNGKKEKIFAKSVLNIQEEDIKGGFSAKISKTLYQQTKSNVLGAIFNGPINSEQLRGTVLPRGSALKIEIN